MEEKLGRILANGKIIDLDNISIEELAKETRETILKQEKLKKQINENLERILEKKEGEEWEEGEE